MALLSPLFLLFLPSTLAYTWTFQNTPKQCQNLTVAISGDDGRGPYRLLMIPFGATPLANAVEARRIIDIPFDEGARSVSFVLKYPEDSQFVVVVSDATGFGSGGTSVAARVQASNDASCFDSKTTVTPLWFFSIDPPNQIVQCQNTRIYWDPSTLQGTPSFIGIIPGGQSFSVPHNDTTTLPGLGTGFTWKPSLRYGTTLILAGGDNRGSGTGGSILNVVSAGTFQDISCLSGSSPSSTPGSPAGGSYPTSSSGSLTSDPSRDSSTNIGAIVGAALGVLAALVIFIVIFWLVRKRRNTRRRAKDKPVDLMNSEEDGDGDARPLGTAGGRGGVNELPEYYQPEPFMMQTSDDPGSISRLSGTSAGGGGGDYYHENGRPVSGVGGSMYASTRMTTPDPLDHHTVFSHQSGPAPSGVVPSSARRKGGPPRPMRPVNFIQHDDAGPSGGVGAEVEPETIELPPTYEAVRKTFQVPQQQQHQQSSTSLAAAATAADVYVNQQQQEKTTLMPIPGQGQT